MADTLTLTGPGAGNVAISTSVDDDDIGDRAEYVEVDLFGHHALDHTGVISDDPNELDPSASTMIFGGARSWNSSAFPAGTVP